MPGARFFFLSHVQLFVLPDGRVGVPGTISYEGPLFSPSSPRPFSPIPRPDVPSAVGDRSVYPSQERSWYQDGSSSQRDSTVFPAFLDTYATRLLAKVLS